MQSKATPNHLLQQERLRRHWSQREVAAKLDTSFVNVSRWERGVTTPGPYFRQQLCELFGKQPQELGLLVDQTIEKQQSNDISIPHVPDMSLPVVDQRMSIWHIPYPRNPFFTGREELLQHLHTMLHQKRTMALTQSWAISGLGGIGKTQIALEYAYRYASEYRFIFWTNAATQETLLADVLIIAEYLQLAEREEPDQKKVLRAVKHWLTTHHEWLLILDNADDVALVRDFLPTDGSGHLLLTSRAQALGSLAQRVDVEKMGLVEGTLFLLHRAKVLAPDAFLDHASEADLAAAEAIVIEMDFLPLALDQAGAYIEEVGCSLSTYLELYRTRQRELLQRRGHLSSDHPEPVATTWSLSFQKIEQANPAAAELLRLCAYLSPDAIPIELFSEGGDDLGPILQHITTDDLQLNEAIEELRKFSLVQHDPGTRLLRVHRLVQAVLKDAMEATNQRRWAERAVQATHAVFPQNVEHATWERCLRFLPQAQTCSGWIEDFAFTSAEATSLLVRTACYLQDVALYEQAEPLLKRALQIREQTLGAEHSLVAETLNTLGKLFFLQGAFAKGEPLFQRALHIQELALGAEHPDVAYPLNNLGIIYLEQGKYAEAEPMLKRALFIRERMLGVGHPKVAYPLTNLGIIYLKQGKYAEAEIVLKRAVSIREQALGIDHPQVAFSLNSLGSLYLEQGKYLEAELILKRALRIREQALGVEHPMVAHPLANLGTLYGKQGKYPEAEAAFQRALQIWEQALGVEHPDVAYPLSCLGDLYTAQENYAEAEQMLTRAVRIREQTPGVNHPKVASSLTNLGNAYSKQGKYEEAEQMLTRAVRIREQALGSEHPELAESQYSLACLFLRQHRPLQAQHYYQQALAIWEKTLGLEHAQVVSSIEGYARLMSEQARE